MRTTTLGGIAAASTAVLLAAGPRPGNLATVDPARPDLLVADVAALLAWGCLLWLCGGVLLTLAARLPGAAGRAAAVTGRVVVPAVLRRAVEAAVGLSVVTGTVAGVALPAATAQTRLADDLTPYDRPVAPPPPATPTPAPPPAPAARPALEVLVVTGDTLWGIAERTLGDDATDADVDAEWRRWYAANRPVIGADPDLIHPGQRLRPPPAS